MKMNIEFVDEKTVKISASIRWRQNKPPFNDRKSRDRDLYVAEFKKKHPSYTVQKITGPAEICNFRDEENSSAEWILTVSKKEKTPLSPPAKPAQPPRPPPTRDDANIDRSGDPRRKLKRKLIKTKKGV